LGFQTSYKLLLEKKGRKNKKKRENVENCFMSDDSWYG